MAGGVQALDNVGTTIPNGGAERGRPGVEQFARIADRAVQLLHDVSASISDHIAEGGRPIVQFLPHRVEGVEIVDGADLKPLVTDDFVLVPNPGECDPGRAYRVSFRAREVD